MKNKYYTLIGILGILYEINKVYLKIYVYTDFKTGTLPSLCYDGIFGFFVIGLESLLLILVIIASLGYNNKLSIIGNKIINISNSAIAFYKNKEK